jgi:hypothetical protein
MRILITHKQHLSHTNTRANACTHSHVIAPLCGQKRDNLSRLLRIARAERYTLNWFAWDACISVSVMREWHLIPRAAYYILQPNCPIVWFQSKGQLFMYWFAHRHTAHTHTTPHESNYLPTLFCMSDIYVCTGIFSHSEREQSKKKVVINICVRNGCAGKKHKLISIVSTNILLVWLEWIHSVNRLEDVTCLMQTSDLIAFF